MQRERGRLAVLLASCVLVLAPGCGGRVDLLAGDHHANADDGGAVDASAGDDAGGADAASDEGVPGDGSAAPDGSTTLLDGATCKQCGGQCVALDDPQHGCASPGCTPCAVPYATAACVAGACAVGSCEPGHADCNGAASDGCEVDLTSAHDDCGACGHACAASQVCLQGSCTVHCGSLQDCSGSCVDTGSDPAHCGSCTTVCPTPMGAKATCQSGQCGFTCAAGTHACGNACADDTSPASCGTSCTACPAPNNGTATCSAGQCGVTCDSGYVACSTGCCSCGDLQNDPHDCGYCGHDCGGQSCVAGVCQSVVVASMQANATTLAVDETNVYWTTQGNTSSVSKAPIAGGAVTVLYASASLYPYGIAVDASHVYVANDIPGGAILSVPISGGSPTTLAGNLNSPQAVALGNGKVYFTLDPYMQTGGGAVMSVPVGGGPVATIASGQNQPASIAVGPQAVVWADQVDVERAPLAGGGPTAVAQNEYPYAVAVDANNVYWGAGINGGVVVQAPLGGGAAKTLATGQYYPNAITVDAQDVYWTTGQGGAGTVMRVPIGGGTPVALATGQAYPNGIAVNSSRVFWVDFGDGTIRSVPK